jgi:hypothetical protein
MPCVDRTDPAHSAGPAGPVTLADNGEAFSGLGIAPHLAGAEKRDVATTAATGFGPLEEGLVANHY